MGRTGRIITPGTVEQGTNGTYTFEKVLGKGSYGQVWLAKRQDGVSVAIKVYHTLNEIMIGAINEELKTLQELTSNNNVCQTYAICLLDYYSKTIYPRIVMDYIQGEPLDKFMASLTREQRNANSTVLKQLILGMDAFHKLGITHQDLKEENIVWDKEKHIPRYIDWGLACLKQYCRYTIAGIVNACKHPCGTSGTAYTMPPNTKFGQFNVKSFDGSKAHDIWSIGVILLDWYTFKQGDHAGKYYDGGSLEGGLNATAPLYLSEYKLAEKIATITNPIAQQVITLLLTRDSTVRLQNWLQVVQLANTIADDALMIEQTAQQVQFNMSQCNQNMGPNTKPDDVLVIPMPNNNAYYCIQKKDLIRSPTFNPIQGTVQNPYTQELFSLNYAQVVDLLSVKTKELFKFNSLEDASIQYLEKVIWLPRLLESCSSMTKWPQYLEIMSTSEGKYHYMLPFFWSMLFGEYNTTNPNLNALFPVRVSADQQILCRWIFDIFSPVECLACMFSLMNSWIDVLVSRTDPIATNQLQLKHVLFCEFIKEFESFSSDFDRLQSCSSYAKGWCDKQPRTQEVIKAIERAIKHSPLFAISWCRAYQVRMDYLYKVFQDWINKN